LIEHLGGKCVKCGSTSDLEFDHIDPTTKSFTLTGKNLDKPWQAVLAEAHLCQLLCGPHHNEKTSSERDAWRHGTLHGYFNRRCRCDECRLVYSTWRKINRSEAGSKPGGEDPLN
jgi:hypothetical protein